MWINYNCTLGHDCKIGDFVTLGPGVQLNGGSEVQDDVYVGSGAVTKDDIKIGRGSIIGSGSVIGKDIPEKSVYYAASGILKTFETDLINNFPEIEYIFKMLDEQLIYISESVKNIITIANDLINSY